MPFPALSCDYDDGYFDKDEHGRVTIHTSVSSDASGAVRIRQWGDTAGRDPYDRTIETRIAAVFPDLRLVKLEQWPWYFDLEKNRLVDASRDVILSRKPAEGDWMTPARITSAIAFVFDLIAVLGWPRVTAPVFASWPPRTTSDRFEFTTVKLALGDFTLELRYRPPYSDTTAPELCVSLSGPTAGASVVVSERGEVFVSLRGGLELHATARALAERWKWT